MLKEKDVENLNFYYKFASELLLMERVGNGGYVVDYESNIHWLEIIDDDYLEPIYYHELSEFGMNKIANDVLKFEEYKAQLQK